jgi:hypothetical protein
MKEESEKMDFNSEESIIFDGRIDVVYVYLPCGTDDDCSNMGMRAGL